MNALSLVQKILAWRLFSRREEVAGAFDIIKWWELRRIPYNIAVGAAGIITLIIVVAVAAITSEKFDEPLGLPDPPIIAVFAVIGYAICANVCFTGGWLVEVLVRKIWRERAGAFAQISFALGLTLSILLTLAPAALFTGHLIARLLPR
jgi:Na+/glutamate symporter